MENCVVTHSLTVLDGLFSKQEETFTLL